MNSFAHRLAPTLASTLAVAAALLSAPSDARAQDVTYSPGSALAVSALATAGPVVAGILADDEGLQLALVSAGLIFGPATGYWTGGASARGWKGLRFRGIVLGATAATIGGICTVGDCQLYGTDDSAVAAVILVGLVGSAVITISSIVDIAEVPAHVRRANEARGPDGVTLSLAPVLLPTNGGTIGMSGSLRF